MTRGSRTTAGTPSSGSLQALGVASLIIAVIYYWVPSVTLGRGIVLLSAVFIASSIVIWRALFEWLSIGLGPAERLLIVGTSAAAVDLARELYDRRHSLGVEFVGFIDSDEAKIGTPVLNPASSARSPTSRRSCASAASIASSSASPTRAASSRWTSCWR